MRAVPLLLAAACAAAAESFQYTALHSCPVCLHIVEDGLPCERFNACAHVPPGTRDCVQSGHCTARQLPGLRRTATGLRGAAPALSATSVRVAKGLGTRPYETLRLSLITEAGAEVSGFDYSAPFQYKWTDNAIHTRLAAHPAPGNASVFDLGGLKVSVRLPAQGQGVAALLIGDPCNSASALGCPYAAKLQTDSRTPEAINTLVPDSGIDFWGILGDNFYDRSGDVTREFYSKLGAGVTSKIMVTLPGNHDYWALGTPVGATPWDQFANGHMQWYAQDSKAAQNARPGDAPFNFSKKPGGLPYDDLPSVDNSFWYNQIGNVGLIGWSSAYKLSDTLPLMKEACAWLGANRRSQGGSIDVGFLVGHWDKPGLGAQDDMDGPGFYDLMKALPGCKPLQDAGMLKLIMGHTHCNEPHPHGNVDVGFMVAGQGMNGCGNYGWPIFDTTEGRVRVWYFETYSTNGTDTFDATMQCVKARGWRGCTAMAHQWLDQPIAPS